VRWKWSGAGIRAGVGHGDCHSYPSDIVCRRIGLCVSLHAQSYPYPTDAEMSDAKTGEVILKPGTLKEYVADFGMLVVPENRGKKDSG